jgi:hypothetical protein
MGAFVLCARLANQLFNLTLSQLSLKKGDKPPPEGGGS